MVRRASRPRLPAQCAAVNLDQARRVRLQVIEKAQQIELVQQAEFELYLARAYLEILIAKHRLHGRDDLGLRLYRVAESR